MSTTPFPPALISTAAFLKRRMPAMRRWPRERLLAFIEWYWRDGRIGIVRDGPKILAVALARAMDDAAQAADEYFHDERGKIVWLDHIASTHPLGVSLLLQQAMQRFGPREAFAGNVWKRKGELRMLPWRIVERLSKAT